MSFYIVLKAVNELCAKQQWQLHRCHRGGDRELRYFITDVYGHVVQPKNYRRRVGLTLAELMGWLESFDDNLLANQAYLLKKQMEIAA